MSSDLVSLRAVSAAERERAASEISGYLAALYAIEGRAVDHGARSAGLLDVRACGGLHAVSGVGYMEGNMRGPSTLDCEKSFARTSVRTANMVKNGWAVPGGPRLVQIQVPA